MSSFGTVSNQDEWVYDYSLSHLKEKLGFYIDTYNQTVRSLPIDRNVDISGNFDGTIKWSSDLRTYAKARKILTVDDAAFVRSLYRPFNKKYYYYSSDLNWSLYKIPDIFPRSDHGNKAFFFTDRGGRSQFSALAVDTVGDLHVCASSDGFQAVARYRFDKNGEQIDNITDWARNKFVKQYGRKASSKDAIFQYIYGVLHDPLYRETYAQNLKREFPRIPFYPDSLKWAAWGERLMALHIGYEAIDPWPLNRKETAARRAEGSHPKPVLKSSPEEGRVLIDADTRIDDIPSEAWKYRLGNRSAIDWVLEQHKGKKPRDATIGKMFNTYAFADYKEEMIDLLAKVVRVSLETVEITDEMSLADRSALNIAKSKGVGSDK
ncbi:type ISP restriction/modification enzyme [Sphingomonas sp. TREG-RG-20F-R18-01]|uniref:type ISP restriction/modification enzyme n=1 Tax=Sphingomonas sp. TREG-RG-20F-R18-01 TaxID=2914982 RepID=UPI001F5702E2|nr:type ISP restriction/modification enzyme [Sphingomonas sp. TREG-RG-20F-R18-01]